MCFIHLGPQTLNTRNRLDLVVKKVDDLQAHLSKVLSDLEPSKRVQLKAFEVGKHRVRPQGNPITKRSQVWIHLW
jgi:hypothetical protein